MSVLTQHNDNRRTGVDTSEMRLTHQAVRTGFRKMFEVEVDPPSAGGPAAWASQIVAQPLFVANVAFPGHTVRDVLVVCTMHGTVYALDAGADCATIWATWLGPPVADLLDGNGQVNDRKDLHGTNPEWGILSTPAIDESLRRIYVVMWHADNGGTFKLHKLDLTTGRDLGSTAIAGQAPGAPRPVFNPVFQKQRPGLLLLKPGDLPQNQQGNVGPEGTVYIAFGASIESGTPYHGWVFAYDVDTLNRRAVWCSTAQGDQGGVWQAGGGLTADEEGNVYAITGNGSFDGHSNFSESFVKLSCKDLRLLSSFTPFNWPLLNQNDNDLGSSGPVCIQGTSFVIGAGKLGVLYSLDRRNLGGNRPHPPDNVVDLVQATGDAPHPNHDNTHHVHGTPVYFEPLSRIYLWGENDVLKAFGLDRATGRLSKSPVATSQVVAPDGMPGGMLSLSSNGAAEAILWALLPVGGGGASADANLTRCVEGVLRAFDATTLVEIWNSAGNLTDRLGHFAKFSSPTIAKGRVYAPTYDGKLAVYGLDPAVPGKVVNRGCNAP